MADIDKQEDIDAVSALVATLDVQDIAEKSNALTGGCLDAEGAARLLILTALTAVRSPGFEIDVAGMRAVYFAGDLRLSFDVEFAKLTLNHGGAA